MTEPPALRVQDAEMDEPELLALAGGEVAIFSASRDGHGGNEDAACALPWREGACVLAVADGMGGERAGARAAALAMEALEQALAEARRQGWMLRTALMNGFERAHAAIRELGLGAGTTLAAVEVEEGAIRPYHVGDSAILLFGQRGRLKLQTIAHSPVGFAVEAGLIDEGEAMHHAQRHLVSNVLGAPDMRIEVGSRRALGARDTLLLASDGLYDNLHTEEIVALLRVGPLAAAAARLAELARTRMHAPGDEEPSKPDDLTFVAFRPRRARRAARSSPPRRTSPAR